MLEDSVSKRELLYFKGREDRSVKINGQLVNLSSMEEVISSLLSLTKLALIYIDTRYIAFYLRDEKSKLNIDLLQSKLSFYTVPKEWISLESFPLTKNGKLDYNRLKEIDLDNTENQLNFKDEWLTSTQLSFLEKYRLILREQTFSWEDSWVQHGGTSIKALQLISLLQKETGYNGLSFLLLFEHDTPSKLWIHINLKDDSFLKVSRLSDHKYECSFSQTQLFLDETIRFQEKSLSIYMINIFLKSNRICNSDRIVKACNSIIQKHSILRTVYSLEEGVPTQTILEGIKLPSSLMTCKDKEEVYSYIKQLKERSLSLDQTSYSTISF